MNATSVPHFLEVIVLFGLLAAVTGGILIVIKLILALIADKRAD